MEAVAIRVFLLDDHEIVRRGVRELLENESDIEVVGEAGSVAEALRRVPLADPQVAIFDVRLPDGSGVEACRELRERDPDLRGIILTSFDDAEAQIQTVLSGASAYLLKNLRGTDIVSAVRRVADGESLLDPSLAKRATERLQRRSDDDALLAGLSAQERRILDLLAEGRTNRQIGEALHLAEKTVKNYVSNLLTKMGMSRRTEAAVYAVQHRRATPGGPSSEPGR
jgi:two-component system, NarL family, response regulator DevR